MPKSPKPMTPFETFRALAKRVVNAPKPPPEQKKPREA